MRFVSAMPGSIAMFVIAGLTASCATDRAVEVCFRSSDYKEGQAAFMEKRKPRFTGT